MDIALPKLPELVHLTPKDLVACLRSGMRDERTATARIVAYLAEVDRRGWFAEDACSSLHDFCVRRLGMSEDSAYRRANAARLARRFPIILEKLQSGAIHLSGLWTLRHLLDAGNVANVLEEVKHKSKRQIENYLAERRPRPDVSSNLTPTDDDPKRQVVEALSPGRVRFEFTGSSSLRDLVEHAADAMRHHNPTGDLGVIFEEAMVLLVATLERQRFAKTDHPKEAPVAPNAGAKIPAAVRRAVFERDGEKCTFENESGERCNASTLLELDHIKPKARGGSNTVENLRVRCRTHNQLAAEKEFGREVIQEKIAARRLKHGKRKNASSVPGQVGSKQGRRSRLTN